MDHYSRGVGAGYLAGSTGMEARLSVCADCPTACQPLHRLVPFHGAKQHKARMKYDGRSGLGAAPRLLPLQRCLGSENCTSEGLLCRAAQVQPCSRHTRAAC